MTKKEFERIMKPSPEKTDRLYLNSGSTLFNIYTTGHPNRGYESGTYNLLAGASSSGKTMFALTTLAEAANDTQFDKYTLVYDGPEKGARMRFDRFFGKKMKKRTKVIKPSRTVEDFYFTIDDYLTKGPVIYVLDSNDVLSAKADDKKFQEQKKAHQRGKETSGSMGMAKAKYHSEHLRTLVGRLDKTGSILIIISQLRDKPNAGPFEERKVRPGGEALKYYACIEAWVDKIKSIKKTYKEKDREQGILSKIRIKKNRSSGRDRTLFIPIYHSYGLDDLGSCVDYLVEEKHWKKRKGRIVCPELDFTGFKEDVIRHVADKSQYKTLHSTVRRVFKEIENAVAVVRPKRYQ